MKKSTKIVELVIDEEQAQLAIDAISLVNSPAIEQNWVFLNKHKKNNLILAKVDKEKRLVIGPALIPNKQIFRVDEQTGEEYYVYFSTDTVKKASELYLIHNNQKSATYEHTDKIAGITTVESWIVNNPKMDKARLYGFKNLPKGTWMVSMKIDNETMWDMIKRGEVKGYSIEGYFIDKMQKMTSNGNKRILEELASILDLDKYSDDYPKGAVEVSQKAMIKNELSGCKCANKSIIQKARFLQAKRPMQHKTIEIFQKYLKNAKKTAKGLISHCGPINFDLWGGEPMLRWCNKKLLAKRQ